MAGQARKKLNVNPPVVGALQRTATKKRYFYVDGKLYRTVRADRSNDLIRAWCFHDSKTVDFVYSDVKRNMQQAFDTAEVATLLNRTKRNILQHVKDGAIHPPYKIGEQAPIKVKGDGVTRFGLYKWSEDDVLALHEHYLTVGSGRPRKDGMLSAATRIPSRMELIAMIRQNRMVYVKNSDGVFVPIFDQPDWT